MVSTEFRVICMSSSVGVAWEPRLTHGRSAWELAQRRSPGMSLRNLFITKVFLPLEGGKRRYASAERTRSHIAARAVRPVRFGPPRSLGRRAAVSVRHSRGWPCTSWRPGGPPRSGTSSSSRRGVRERDHQVALVDARPPRQGRAMPLPVPIYPLAAALGAALTVYRSGDRSRPDRRGRRRERGPDGGLGGRGHGTRRGAGASRSRPRGGAPGADLPLARRIGGRAGAARDRATRRDSGRSPASWSRHARTRASLPLDELQGQPLHGDLHGLPPTTAFTSTDDLLSPDSHRLREACSQAGVSCEVVDAPGMPHDYPLLADAGGRCGPPAHRGAASGVSARRPPT